jgi:hypothetical protein
MYTRKINGYDEYTRMGRVALLESALIEFMIANETWRNWGDERMLFLVNEIKSPDALLELENQMLDAGADAHSRWERWTRLAPRQVQKKADANILAKEIEASIQRRSR